MQPTATLGGKRDGLAVGTMLDERYRVEGLPGRGGMADVVRAVDTILCRSVAVKVLRDVDPTNLHRFRSEREAMALLDHPGVPAYFAGGWHDGAPYLVVELVGGPSLASLLADGPLELDRTLVLGEQLADALTAAHARGIVHRDIKPSNVLFDEVGQAHLADFGIAQLDDVTSVTGLGLVVGTAPYVAPEVLENQRASGAADVYALGLLLIECHTGARCYPGTPIEAAMARLHHPPTVPPDLPAWLRTVLAAMTAREPAQRPSAEAVARSFRTRSVDPTVPSAPPEPRRRRVSDPVFLALVAAVLVTLFVVTRSASPEPTSVSPIPTTPGSTPTTLMPEPVTTPTTITPVPSTDPQPIDVARAASGDEDDEGDGERGRSGTGNGDGNAYGHGKDGGDSSDD